jgi:hypothetical protein
MNTINRQVAVIKPKEPYVSWVNSIAGMPGDPYSIESLNNDCTALLLPHFDDDEESLKFVKKIYKELFEFELSGWSTDRKSWPKKRNYTLFRDWFRIESHSEVFDFGEGSIESDEY